MTRIIYKNGIWQDEFPIDFYEKISNHSYHIINQPIIISDNFKVNHWILKFKDNKCSIHIQAKGNNIIKDYNYLLDKPLIENFINNSTDETLYKIVELTSKYVKYQILKQISEITADEYTK